MIGSTIFYFVYKGHGKKTTKSTISLVKKKEKEEKKEIVSSDEVYKVDIKGQIMVPGIYSLDPNSRVIDVIEKAGGLTEFADTSVINLSRKIKDEMVIIIYSREEVANFYQTKIVEKQVQETCVQKDETALKNDACISSTTDTSGKISINTASVEELSSLSGIGKSRAKDIITYREENGPFTKIEDIMNVSGIGESLFASIKEDITV